MNVIKKILKWLINLTCIPIGYLIMFWPSVLTIYVGHDLSFMHMYMFTLIGVLLSVMYLGKLSGLVSVQINKYNFTRIQSNKRSR